jgi:hypothetical protein
MFAEKPLHCYSFLAVYVDVVLHNASNALASSLAPVYGIFMITIYISEQRSSVSVVSGYGLDDRAMEVRSPAEEREFFV